MADIPEFPQKKSGALLGLAAVEYLLRRDDAALNETIQGADDVELGFAVAWLAGHIAASVACTAADPLAVIAGWRRQLLDGG